MKKVKHELGDEPNFEGARKTFGGATMSLPHIVTAPAIDIYGEACRLIGVDVNEIEPGDMGPGDNAVVFRGYSSPYHFGRELREVLGDSNAMVCEYTNGSSTVYTAWADITSRHIKSTDDVKVAFVVVDRG